MKAIRRREFIRKSFAGSAGLKVPFMWENTGGTISMKKEKLLNTYNLYDGFRWIQTK